MIINLFNVDDVMKLKSLSWRKKRRVILWTKFKNVKVTLET